MAITINQPKADKISSDKISTLQVGEVNDALFSDAILARLFVVLVQKLLADNVISASDFPVEERQRYQELRDKVVEYYQGS